jgi:hypothetical protein
MSAVKKPILVKITQVLSFFLANAILVIICAAAIMTVVNQQLSASWLHMENIEELMSGPANYAAISQDVLEYSFKIATYLVLIMWILVFPTYLHMKKQQAKS